MTGERTRLNEKKREKTISSYYNKHRQNTTRGARGLRSARRVSSTRTKWESRETRECRGTSEACREGSVSHRTATSPNLTPHAHATMSLPAGRDPSLSRGGRGHDRRTAREARPRCPRTARNRGSCSRAGAVHGARSAVASSSTRSATGVAQAAEGDVAVSTMEAAEVVAAHGRAMCSLSARGRTAGASVASARAVQGAAASTAAD